MADEPNAATAVAGDTTAATTSDATEDKTLLGNGDVVDTTADTTGAEPDWRSRIAELGGFKDDAREMAWLNRFASEANYHKAIPKLRRDFSAGKAAPSLPDNATADEVAAYRKAAGIPENPDGYDIKFPDALGATEADTGALNDFKSWAHERHMTPAAVKTAADWYMKRIADSRVAQAEAAKEATMAGLVELRSEWKGKEFTRNLALALENVETALGDKSGELAHLQLANGQKLGDHPLFLRYAVFNGRAGADEEALIGGDGAGGGKSLDDEIKDLVDKSVASKLSGTEDKRLNDLYAARIARDERKNRAA